MIDELLVHHELLPQQDRDLARFERWLAERLDIPRRRSDHPTPHDERLDWIGRCLVGDLDTLPYRVTAALLRLYAQPLVRIAALHTEQVQVTPTDLRILPGKEAAAVPEPFAQLLRDHLAARPNLRTANTDGSPWIFPSTRAGHHLRPNTIMARLRDLGIDLLGTRNTTLRDHRAVSAL